MTSRLARTFLLVAVAALAGVSGCDGSGGGTTPSYSVGGTIAGLSGTGLVLDNNGGNSTTVSQNGSFRFGMSIMSGDTYDVTVATQPSNPAQNCTVTNGTGTVGAGNVSAVTISCGDTYQVGGYVAGLEGTGLTISYNDGAAVAPSGNGYFTAATGVVAGTAYTISIGSQPTSPSQVCTLTGGTGTVEVSNTASALVVCAQAVGRLAYVVSAGTVPPNMNPTLGSISTYAINATNGALANVLGSVSAGPQPKALQFIPHTTFAWSLNFAAEITTDATFQQSGIYDYSVDSATGLLTLVSGSPFTALDGTTSTPGCGSNGQSGLGATQWLSIAPSGSFGFATNEVNQHPPQENANTWRFNIDSSTGIPTLVSDSSVSAICSGEPNPITIDPTGRFAYVAFRSDVLAFQVSSTGSLTALTGGSYPASGTENVVIDPAGRFLYAIGSDIYVFTIDPSSGVLTAVPGNPLAVPAISMVISPSDEYAYVLRSGVSGGISVYSINATGALSTATGAAAVPLNSPTYFTIDPSGQFAYAAASNTSGSMSGIYAYTVNSSTGALTPVAGSPFDLGTAAAITITD